MWELTARPAWRFFRDYFVFSGWRDGRVGFVASALSAFAAFLKYAFLFARSRSTERMKLTILMYHKIDELERGRSTLQAISSHPARSTQQMDALAAWGYRTIDFDALARLPRRRARDSPDKAADRHVRRRLHVLRRARVAGAPRARHGRDGVPRRGPDRRHERVGRGEIERSRCSTPTASARCRREGVRFGSHSVDASAAGAHRRRARRVDELDALARHARRAARPRRSTSSRIRSAIRTATCARWRATPAIAARCAARGE